MAGSAALTPQQQYQMAVQQNMAARAAILAYGVKRTQQIFSASFTPGSQNVVNIPPQNVGLIQGFLVEVNGNIANTDGALALTRSEFGVSNVLSNITFSDLSNYIRHNTTGWHLSQVTSAKQGFVWGGAFQPNVPEDWTAYNTSFANTNLVTPNWNVRSAPLTIIHGANANVREIYYVPVAYSANDLRGAIYAAVTNATMNLQLTINPTPTVAAGADATNAVYVGAPGGWNGQVTITVYQVYYDQLPTATQNGQTTVVLPLMDLNNQYCLLQTSLTGMVSGQDFPYGYANFRSYLSTIAVVDNVGVLSAGNEINYVALTSANNTNIFKYTPEIAALLARQTFMADPPKGMYYFDFRNNPINTNQFGNMNLNFNPNGNITAGATLLVGVEYFAQQTQVSGAQSLAAS